MTVELYLYLLGFSYSIGSERWTVEKCLYANGRRTLEAAIEQGVHHIRGYKERTFPVPCYQWKKVILRCLAFPQLEFMKGFYIMGNLRNWLYDTRKVWCCKKYVFCFIKMLFMLSENNSLMVSIAGGGRHGRHMYM